jgi:transcriptional regulator with XRE-family HTH domain
VTTSNPPKSPSAKELGRAIKRARSRLRLSQDQLARRLGYSRAATVSDWERGEAAPPAEKLEEIAELAGVTVEQLFGEAEPREPETEGGDLLARSLYLAEKAAALRAEAAVIEARAAETRAMAFREAEQGATLRASRLGGVAPGQPISDEEIRELPPPPQQQGGRRRAAGG